MNIVLGVSGGIAAFKTAQLVSNLKKSNHNVTVIMTKNAMEFIAPLTFETLSGNKVYYDTFDRNFNFDVHHIELAKKADLFIIVPCTANVMAKIANGIADDMLTTTFLACNAQKIICPAMNTNMLNNPVTQLNMQKCKDFNIKIVNSQSGMLACGDIGDGKLADLAIIEDEIEMALSKKPLLGKNILISAGPTREKIDLVRYITNHSSGKMGYALARACRNLGAHVTLVSGKTNLKPLYKTNFIQVESAAQMYNTMIEEAYKNEIIIMAAAVADYTVKKSVDYKIKKADDFNMELVRTKDILKKLGEIKKEQLLIGFAMESENLIENAKIKLLNKNCDYVIANSINQADAGFQTDTNIVNIISKTENISLPLMNKIDVAYAIIERCILGGK